MILTLEILIQIRHRPTLSSNWQSLQPHRITRQLVHQRTKPPSLYKQIFHIQSYFHNQIISGSNMNTSLHIFIEQLVHHLHHKHQTIQMEGHLVCLDQLKQRKFFLLLPQSLLPLSQYLRFIMNALFGCNYNYFCEKKDKIRCCKIKIANVVLINAHQLYNLCQDQELLV